MNILFFLTPKNDVAYVYSDFTVRQTLEKMEYHQYAAVPMIDYEGKYVGTITEGDLLWKVKKEYDLDIHSMEDICILDIARRLDYKPVYANSKMEDLVLKSMHQNFVPVIDDNQIFIGIIRRRDILQFFYKQYLQIQ